MLTKTGRDKMVGIKDFGFHVPIYRLSVDEINTFWFKKRSRGGKKAVAGFDEDVVTMATSAVLDCYKENGIVKNEIKNVDLMLLATTCSPYKEKLSAAIVATACGLKENAVVAELSGSIRGGSSAFMLVNAALKGGSFGEAIIVISECRKGLPASELEQSLGDGAIAVTLSQKEEDVCAVIEKGMSIYKATTDFWRKDEDKFVQKTDQRFIEEAVYVPLLEHAISRVLKEENLTPSDFGKAVIYGYNDRVIRRVGEKIGFDKAQLQESFFSMTGNMGLASAFLMLYVALSNSKPGDLVLFATYGDGADVYVLRTTERVSQLSLSKLMSKLNKEIAISYADYLRWHDIIDYERPNLAPRLRPSVIAQWRRLNAVLQLEGVKCVQCGCAQFSPIGQAIRVCINCQAKDSFEPYRFSDKKGKLFTYSIDWLQTGKTVPGINGVVDFDDGGRLVCELTDCTPEQIYPGMPIEMTLRKYSEYETITYFWKAKPALYD